MRRNDMETLFYYYVCSVIGIITFVAGNFLDNTDHPLINIAVKAIAGWCIGSVLGAVAWGYLTTV